MKKKAWILQSIFSAEDTGWKAKLEIQQNWVFASLKKADGGAGGNLWKPILKLCKTHIKMQLETCKNL